MLTWILAGILIVIGVVGLLFPLLPGSTFLLAGMWLAAWNDDYQRVSGVTLGILAALVALSFAVDWGASALGAKKAGASRAAISGAFVGSILGVFVGLWGLLIFPFFGALLGEWMTHRDHEKAARVGIATALATALGMAAKIAIGFAMLGIFAWAWFW